MRLVTGCPPFPLHRAFLLRRPGAVKGARFVRGASEPLTARTGAVGLRTRERGRGGCRGTGSPTPCRAVCERGNQGPKAAHGPARRNRTQRLHNCVLSELAGFAARPSAARLVPDKTNYVRANAPHIRAGSLRRRRFARGVRIASSSTGMLELRSRVMFVRDPGRSPARTAPG